jgi:hypothetical protein
MSRWARCPGSYKLSRDTARPRGPSIHAATGTVAHDLIEASLMRPTATTSPDVRGEVREVDGHSVTIDDDMLAGVAVMDDYVRRIAPEFEKSCGSSGACPWTVLPEELPGARSPCLAGPTWCWSRPSSAGAWRSSTTSMGAAWGGRRGQPPAPVLCRRRAAELDPAGDAAKIDRVRLTVVQPRIDPDHPIKSWDTSALDVELWVDAVLIPAVRAASEPDAPLVPGDWCRFCPAARVCPRLEEAAMEAAQNTFEPIPPISPSAISTCCRWTWTSLSGLRPGSKRSVPMLSRF